jgi:pimeloyl-ACP methyl ester carboxylesterase
MRLIVKEIGNFFVGGRTIELHDLEPRDVTFTPDSLPARIDQNGEFDAFQMYVQYVKVADGDGGPLLLWHGGGLTGAMWERTPDDRPGWQSHFLEAGYDVYVSDAVERGRSSWARHPEIYPSAPVFRSKAEAWSLFRIGPAGGYAPHRRPFGRTQFPVSAFDTFTKVLVPRWLCNDDATQAAYDALLERVGPCTIVAHSQGAMFALNAAVRAPHLVRAVVAIEPSGVPHPDDEDALRSLCNVPHLFVWGDFVKDHPFWHEAYTRAERYAVALRRAGVECERLVLPENGLFGNSHFPMLDRNSEHVARFARAWLEQHAIYPATIERQRA